MISYASVANVLAPKPPDRAPPLDGAFFMIGTGTQRMAGGARHPARVTTGGAIMDPAQKRYVIKVFIVWAAWAAAVAVLAHIYW